MPETGDQPLATEETLVIQPGDLLVVRVSPDRIRSLGEFEEFAARLKKAHEDLMPDSPAPLLIVADQLAVQRADGV